MVSGAAHKTTTIKMIYQYNSDLQIIAQHRTLEDASRALGVPMKTLSSAIVKKSFCRLQWYFSHDTEFVLPQKPVKEKGGRKFTVMVKNSVWDRMLVVIGQRNKQDIFRNLLSGWLENEERKHDGTDNKEA